MQVYSRCKEMGFVLPSVYQGQYNALWRQCEQEVFPCIRHLGMSFVAFSPLAAGVLATDGGRSSARLSDRTEPQPFDIPMGRSDTPSVLREAKDLIVSACADHSVDLTYASLRWMLNHSLLREGDALISGGQNTQDLRPCLSPS